ncbi:Sialic acid synthase [Vibrio sinaloensis DSM 21326]|uniref:Sialic acid synthase n=1 Tax=Vibrio sinaloensis DSM 21326 TaxID=945550 RepID=E8M577_PHOS4|nr:N-acetylneuraminate synthase family protein [Vibrio sinaloensis]EGA70928.1 Sialic acid synthase [Vibrio sinaloensis DSM 21326]
MTSIKLNNGRIIGEGHLPYFVAELNTSHFGDVDLAKEMIDEAKAAGCDCVKFQSWTTDTLYSQTYYDKNPIAKRFVKKYSLSEQELGDLAEYCHNQSMGFASTPYSLKEAEFLVKECKPPFIKIASMELNNKHFLRQLGQLDTSIVLSTGMGDINEVEFAVRELQDAGARDLCVLHCVSIYPAPSEAINLNNIVTLQNRLKNVVVGYSDHTIGSEVAVASVALGAGFIEKHFTLDNQRIGMDNQMATPPQEMKLLVEQCKSAFNALGSFERVVSQEEYAQRENMRRSVVSARQLSKGDVLTLTDIVLKRPGTGVPADRYESVIGKVVTQDIAADQVIDLSALK